MPAATSLKFPSFAPEREDRPASESRIDADSHFNGLYETRQNLRIEGVAEGDIQCDGTLTVAEGARVKAKVTASTVTIAGTLEGEVVCHGVFQIMPSGQVDATVSARRLIVQEGGLYNGEFRMITEEAPAAKPAAGKPAAAKPAAAPEARPSGKRDDLAPTRPAGTLSSEEWWAQMTGGEPPKDEAPNDDGKPD